MKYFIHLRWLLPLVLVGVVIWHSLLSTSVVSVFTPLLERTTYVSQLLPAARVELSGSKLVLLQEPVYIDVTLPVRTSAVEIELVTTADSPYLRLGVQQGAAWDFSFPDVARISTSQDQRYRLRVTNFPYFESGYRLRFLISVPNFSARSIIITGAYVNIERQPFSWQWLTKAVEGFPDHIL